MDDILKQKDLEISTLKLEIESLKERLKKYTTPSRNKVFYQKHKEEIIKKVKEHKEKTGYHSYYSYTPEQRKEFLRKMREARQIMELQNDETDAANATNQENARGDNARQTNEPNPYRRHLAARRQSGAAAGT